MRSTPEPSTSSSDDESVNIYPRDVPVPKEKSPNIRKISNKEILRLIFMGQLSLLLVHLHIENGNVTIKSATNDNFHKISRDRHELSQLFDRSIEGKA